MKNALSLSWALVGIVLATACTSSPDAAEASAKPTKTASQDSATATPTPTPTPQLVADCARIARNSICTMEYQPAVCRLDVGGKTYQGRGSNPCRAGAALEVELCLQKVDVSSAQKDAMKCGPDNVEK